MSTTATHKIVECKGCKQPFEYEPTLLQGREVFSPKYCPDCVEKEEMAQVEAQGHGQNLKRAIAWESICPAEYRECDPARIPTEYAQLIRNWRPNGRGIGLVGESGLGKTRTLFAILRHLHFEGLRVDAVSAAKFSILTTDQFSDDPDVRGSARARIAACHAARVLILDDLEKARFSDRYEMELYTLLEHRTSHRLPVLWSANTIGDDLGDMFSAGRKDPILRRLVEFSEIL